MNYYNPNINGLEQYIVKQNDSLYLIAKKYGVTVEDLKETNHLVGNMIYPNQILFIPNTSKSTCITTKPSDSVKSIIEKYKLTLNDIVDLKVVPNQALRLDDYKTYTVKYGDTIEDVLAKHHLSPLEFLKLNESKFLLPGEKIIIEK